VFLGALVFSYNSGQRLLQALSALTRQRTPLRQIIVVDSGSEDGSPQRAIAEFPGVRLITLNGNPGLPAARNAGLAALQDEFVLMLDADVYVNEDCIARLLEAQRRFDVAVVCPRILLLPDRDRVQADGAEAHFVGTMSLRNAGQPPAGLPVNACDVGACVGACMLVHRASVIDAGGFDARYFFHFEDLEFGLRMRSLGHRLVCEPTAIVHHDRGAGSSGLSFRGSGAYPAQRAYLTTRNRLLTIFTHYRLRTLLVLAPALAAYELAALALVLKRGWLGAWLRAWWWQVAHRASILERRRWIQERRIRNDRDVLVGGPLPFSVGFVSSSRARTALACLSFALDAYWRLTRRWSG
jgi:hypothetical protein